jgi:hypothetical protein
VPSPTDKTYNDDFVKSNDYLLFVHGFNVNDTEKKQWPATVFKRLWWQGYTGHVGFFDWPCEALDLSNPKCYDNSDFNAWQCGAALRNRFVSLNSGKHSGKVRVIAHSQGNIITGEAIRRSPNNILHTYIATQAAISGDCYQSGLKPYFTSYTTPNVRANYPQTGEPYLTGIDKKVGKRFNYYNIGDYALRTMSLFSWEANNKMRPDIDYWYTEGDNDIDTYKPDLGDRFYYAIVPYINERSLLFPANTFEIFSYDAEARASAIGVLPSMDKGIFTSFNLRNAPLRYDNQHYSHSRQFRSNIVAEWQYWSKVIGNAALPHIK